MPPVLRFALLAYYRRRLLLFSSDDFILNVTLQHSPTSSKVVTNVRIEFYFPPFIKFGGLYLDFNDGFIKTDPDKNIFYVSITSGMKWVKVYLNYTAPELLNSTLIYKSNHSKIGKWKFFQTGAIRSEYSQ